MTIIHPETVNCGGGGGGTEMTMTEITEQSERAQETSRPFGFALNALCVLCVYIYVYIERLLNSFLILEVIKSLLTLGRFDMLAVFL